MGVRGFVQHHSRDRNMSSVYREPREIFFNYPSQPYCFPTHTLTHIYKPAAHTRVLDHTHQCSSSHSFLYYSKSCFCYFTFICKKIGYKNSLAFLFVVLIQYFLSTAVTFTHEVLLKYPDPLRGRSVL